MCTGHVHLGSIKATATKVSSAGSVCRHNALSSVVIAVHRSLNAKVGRTLDLTSRKDGLTRSDDILTEIGAYLSTDDFSVLLRWLQRLRS